MDKLSPLVFAITLGYYCHAGTFLGVLGDFIGFTMNHVGYFTIKFEGCE